MASIRLWRGRFRGLTSRSDADHHAPGAEGGDRMIGTAHMAAALYAAHAGGKADVPFDALPQEDWSRWCAVARTARDTWRITWFTTGAWMPVWGAR